jgi:hypothetical protein
MERVAEPASRTQSLTVTLREIQAETAIGLFACALAVAAMAVDHLIPGDPIAFLLTSVVALALAALLFGRLIPRTKASPESSTVAAKRGILVSFLAILSIPTLFVGLPFVLGASAVALGLLGRSGSRHRLATAAVVIGMLVVLFAIGVYVVLGDSET